MLFEKPWVVFIARIYKSRNFIMLFEMHRGLLPCRHIYKSRNFIMLFEFPRGKSRGQSTKVEILLCYLSHKNENRNQRNLQK